MIFESHYLFLILLFSVGCNITQSNVLINIPDAEAETDYIWQTIQDLNFFEEHNYQVSLPKGALIESLRIKAKNNHLSENDYQDLKRFIKDSIYDRSAYLQGYNKIKKQLPLIYKMIAEINLTKRTWAFKEFDPYQVNLTLYGPGGSYNADNGSILLYTTPDGKFKQYDNPANTIIHEITHIGIEASIINKFKVPHPLKERIIDKFVFLHFNQYLPDYKIQNMGDERIDPYLRSKEDFKKLDEFVERIMKKN